MVAAFGESIIGEDGFINRRTLGSIVFSSPQEMRKLTDITWPLIYNMAKEEINASHAVNVVVEAAVLLQADWKDLVDEIWLVETDRSNAIERLQKRNSFSIEECEKRLDSQWSNERCRAFADHVIRNNGSVEELENELIKLL